MARRDPPTVSQKISFCPGMRCESLMVFSGNPHKSQCDKRGEDHATVTIVSHRSSDLHPVTAKRDAFGVSRPSSNGETVSGPVVSGLGESKMTGGIHALGLSWLVAILLTTASLVLMQEHIPMVTLSIFLMQVRIVEFSKGFAGERR